MIRLLAYVWLGMVLGVSFLATPIKFRAESLTLPVALDVGRATFHAFGKVEWLMSVALLIFMYRVHATSGSSSVDWSLVALVVAIVIAQSSWLLPVLDARVAAIIDGATLARSHSHTIYAGLELAKGLLLLAIGLRTSS